MKHKAKQVGHYLGLSEKPTTQDLSVRCKDNRICTLTKREISKLSYPSVEHSIETWLKETLHTAPINKQTVPICSHSRCDNPREGAETGLGFSLSCTGISP